MLSFQTLAKDLMLIGAFGFVRCDRFMAKCGGSDDVNQSRKNVDMDQSWRKVKKVKAKNQEVRSKQALYARITQANTIKKYTSTHYKMIWGHKDTNTEREIERRKKNIT